ncbi:hypothetical protein JG688_00018099 [Phytophthora aleatoria]|uniref:Uncharacterized protein n=1 Tax=Phytophthora aleatoria TaxID=2496075 RepID=A0A8J5IGE5_9STRA|nr:hypothetical protein JG688_00018099 [Phytophthora aleatoria]
MAEEENILQFHSEAAALFVSKEVHFSRSENLGTFQNDARHFTEASSHVERCTAHTPSKPIYHPSRLDCGSAGLTTCKSKSGDRANKERSSSLCLQGGQGYATGFLRAGRSCRNSQSQKILHLP